MGHLYHSFIRHWIRAKGLGLECVQALSSPPSLVGTQRSTGDEVLQLTQFLDEFLVLVELLECLYIHTRDPRGLGLVTVGGVAQHTHLELGTRDVTQPWGRGEGDGEYCLYTSMQ